MEKVISFLFSFLACQEEGVYKSDIDEPTFLTENVENEAEESQRDNDNSSDDDYKKTKRSKPRLKRGRKRKTKVEVNEEQESEPPSKRNKTEDGIEK